MEILATELAKLLDIGVDKATELYPLLGTQYVFYSILGNLQDIAAIIGIILVLVASVFYFCTLMDDADDDVIKLRKFLVGALITGIVLIIVGIVAFSFKLYLAPDISLLLNLTQ